jgi:hypothetical protein
MRVEPFVALLREVASLGSFPSVTDLSQLIARQGWSSAGRDAAGEMQSILFGGTG